ncbi:MAG: Vi polysaccharide biosynthesis protein VipA/TviB [Flavobacteriales bacterium]|nr:Vi polysaccharide biosynthesis protein VipA/TviB [Flavobacteriales bacterium]|tara:strand:+ start:1064 stop:2329 length:1266 start_codon:yes stop_codon:yes gene_type:complete
MKDKIAVIGLGYVGIPLAVELGKKYSTVGFDINAERINELNEGFDRTLEITSEALASATQLSYTTSVDDLSNCNIYIITVPTPINHKNLPDLTPLRKSSEAIGSVLSEGDIVIYESTVYPGVTEEECVPILEAVSGLKFNEEFFCGYSPERINPGDKERTLTNILKITSGSTPEIAQRVDELYKSIITAGTHLAPSIKVAEAAKVIENTQRDVNIALVNELALIFDTMGISSKDVLEAAGTKWNFLKFKPGLVGGHCIGVDPYYLTYKAEKMGYKPNLILSSRQINNGMSAYVAKKTIRLLVEEDKNIKDANILIMGLTFKENCPDIRNTKVIDIIEELKDFGCQVDVYDPWVDKEEEKRTYNHGLIEDPFQSNKKYAAIIVAVSHNQFLELTNNDFASISEGSPVVIDIKGIVDNPSWRL